MKSGIVSIAIVAVALAATGSAFPHPKTPKRCCMPKTYQVNVGVNQAYSEIGTTVHGLIRVVDEYAMKSEEKIAAVRVRDGSTYKELSRLVMDYGKQLLYNITGTTCVKSPVTTPFPAQCLPDSAQYIGEFYFGGGNDTLYGEYWKIKDSSLQVEEGISFTRECYPIATDMTVVNGNVEAYITTGYTGMVDKITDPSLFQIPAGCHNEIPKQGIIHFWLVEDNDLLHIYPENMRALPAVVF